MNVDKIITGILKREGWPKYTNDPADMGGPTKAGVTLKSWRAYSNNQDATVDDLRAMTEDQARGFYRRRYVIEPGFERIRDPFLRELVVDAGVHHGTRHATKWLQYAANVKQDGSLGPKTRAAINNADPRELYLWIIAYRMRLFGRLVGRDPELKKAQAAGFNLQARWAGGWNNRIAEFVEHLAERLEREYQRNNP